MADVFISYARQDEAVARRIAKALHANGHGVWWDAELPAHRTYSDTIEQNLRAAKAVVVLWSANSAGSQWVRAEADLARSESKLVQAQLDSTLPPLPFNQIQCADLSNWRGNRRHAGWRKLAASVEALVVGEPTHVDGKPARPRVMPMRTPLLVGLAVALLAAAALLLWPRLTGGEANARPVVAVLPFTSAAAADEALVSGIWEDTRQALSTNPDLTVLGPHSSQELAERGSTKALRAVDYLLEANVRKSGPMIRVSTSLVRAKDGAQIWSQTFDRKLDDVFALQSELAREIEGRIRGRLARGGGVLPEHITTSGEVYALFSEARTNVKRRGPAINDAHVQLLRVVEMDPNFAPAWAELAKAEKLRVPVAAGREALAGGSSAEQYARKAIALAPNLASGYAALGLTADFDEALAETALRKAVKLNPNDVESVTWLANLVNGKHRQDEALELYSRAIDIEPLWWPPIGNKLQILLERRDQAGVEAELSRIGRLDAPLIETMATIQVAMMRSDQSKAIQAGLAYFRRAPAAERQFLATSLAIPLVQLGHLQEAIALRIFPDFALPVWKNDSSAIPLFERLGIPPRRMWASFILPLAMIRTYLNHGEHEKVAELYFAAANTPEEFLRVTGSDESFTELAPLVALGLIRSGRSDEARRLLVLADQLMMKHGEPRSNDELIRLARIRAVQGRNGESVTLLAKAKESGWSPGIPLAPSDLAVDPGFALLAPEPRFQQIRRDFLTHFAKERAELGPVSVE